MDFTYRGFTFSDCSGVVGESVGYDANGEFKIIVQIGKSPRDRQGELKGGRWEDGRDRTKRNKELIEAAVDAFWQGSFGNMNVGGSQQITEQAKIERIK